MDIAVDLGSDRTRVFIENKGIVLDEASVVAFDVDTYDIVGVGNEAYKMIGKTPAGIRAMHPIDDGVISRSELVEDMVSILIKEVSPSKVTMPRVVASIPSEDCRCRQRYGRHSRTFSRRNFGFKVHKVGRLCNGRRNR